MEKLQIKRKLSDSCKKNAADSIGDIVDVIIKLRGEGGCPWDQKQTPDTMWVYLIEEVYELVDAIKAKDTTNVCEELGDLLFLVLFILRLYEEKGKFDISDVAKTNIDKMIRRHPHVFSNVKVNSVSEVKKNWDKIKSMEKGNINADSILDSVPSATPALVRAYAVSKRAAKTGFDWDDLLSVMDKVDEEWAEFKTAIKSQDKNSAKMEFGDVIFTLTNVARFMRFHPEDALTDSINKFESRFKFMEKEISKRGGSVFETSFSEFEKLWEKAKE